MLDVARKTRLVQRIAGIRDPDLQYSRQLSEKPYRGIPGNSRVGSLSHHPSVVPECMEDGVDLPCRFRIWIDCDRRRSWTVWRHHAKRRDAVLASAGANARFSRTHGDKLYQPASGIRRHAERLPRAAAGEPAAVGFLCLYGTPRLGKPENAHNEYQLCRGILPAGRPVRQVAGEYPPVVQHDRKEEEQRADGVVSAGRPGPNLRKCSPHLGAF